MTDSALEAFTAHAPGYDAARRRLVPGYDLLYGTVLDALGELDPPPRRILELGAGTGLLSAMVAEAQPQAELVLVDGAEAMLDQARKVLGARAGYHVADLRDPLPSGEYDAVFSALAIHHLDDDDKRRLFGRVHDALAPNGVFVNAEQVLAPTPRLEQDDVAWHHDAAVALGTTPAEWAGALERMAHDRSATVEAQLIWLRQAGFTDVDCRFKQRRMALLFARR